MNHLQDIQHSSQDFQSSIQEMLQKGSLSILAGRRMMGKLSSLSRLAMYGAQQQKQTVFLTADSTKERLDEYVHSFLAKEQDTLSLSVHETENITIQNIVDYIEQHEKIDALFIDELYAIRTKDNRFAATKEEIHHIIETLHHLAKNNNIAIVVGGTLNRQLERRENKRPLLSDFQFNDDTYDLFDNILTLYRDEVYNLDSDSPNTLETVFLKSTAYGKLSVCVKEPYHAKV